MIYTVTLNPALDYHLKTDNLKLGCTNRSTESKLLVGGKGINVSFVLKELGIESVALGFVAGFTGDELENTLMKNGIKTDFSRLSEGLTRINVKLSSDVETEINATGPVITAEDIAKLKQKLEVLQSGDILILAGSVPLGVDSNVYAELMSSVPSSVKAIVDTSGQALLDVLKHRPFLIKPNRDELQEAVGHTLTNEKEVVEAAFELQRMGARNVLVSLGADGAVLVADDGVVYKEKAKAVSVKSTVGAGDSMVAGFVSALDKGYGEALKLAVAVGTATASVDGLARYDDIVALV